MSAELPLIDLSYILEISGNDNEYVAEVTGIFLDTMASGLPKLIELTESGVDYEQIHKQAHFLKSSAGIIKVRNNYDLLVKINSMSLEKAGMEEIKNMAATLIKNFEEATEELTNIRDHKN